MDTVVQSDARAALGLAAYALDPAELCKQFETDATSGLTGVEASARLAQFGENRIAAQKPPSVLLVLLKNLRDPMNIMLLLVAAAGILIDQWPLSVLVCVLVLVNVGLATQQAVKARGAVDALAGQQVAYVRVIRDGVPASVDAALLVPGDIVQAEAGDSVAADGRILVAANLQTQEAALTGESAPVDKNAVTLAGNHGDETALGDQSNMVFQGTTLVRGTTTFVVTATGMATEIGRIATMLAEVDRTDSPLQRELGALTKKLAFVAWGAVVVMVGIGVLRGLPFDQLLLLGISVAVSAIPTGMPTFVQSLLAYGARILAEHRAVVKSLTDVETLGATTAIATDKTGTLTMNEMAVVELYANESWYRVEGEGYAKTGRILGAAGTPTPGAARDNATASGSAASSATASGSAASGAPESTTGTGASGFEQMAYALCLVSDATVSDAGVVVGDPTEAAMVVLAAKLGVDAVLTRRAYPRLAEVPFDSEYKFMATWHRVPFAGAERLVGLVKGAPDVIAERCTAAFGADGTLVPIEQARAHIEQANHDLAARGLRVLALAIRVHADAELAQVQSDPFAAVGELTFVGLLGMIDPLRPAAIAAVAQARAAGISVRMITGDHVVTASAIGEQLGLGPGAATGAQFRGMTDEQALAGLPELHVLGRVAPEDKLRLVQLLMSRGEVVAMTGDAINDAAAIKAASMGVAMGSGSEVTKQAARMVLTDDNFGTLVEAIRLGRSMYDKIVAYVRYQMSNLIALVLLFLTASVVGIADGVPLTPAMVLFLGFFISTPPLLMIMFDTPGEDVMRRPPRAAGASLSDRRSLVQWVSYAVIILIVTLVPLLFGPDAPRAGVATASATMAFVIMGLTNSFSGIVLRRDPTTGLAAPLLMPLLLLGAPLVLLLLATSVPVLQSILSTVSLTGYQWFACIGLSFVLPVVVELDKLARRARAKT
ncbi:cation-translocating P-type ATPase [Rathayibacter soli]|uniref:cation-translocating P-type ATPase n=1 Tax=Rathayibacter soli TaxID=3144168 RepID=UPI0027E4DCFF|nr:cation-transporting P-type ATPase [Glaciibacter superstes]